MAVLNASHRCDACSSRAYVLTLLKTGGILAFCAHHAAQHLPTIRERGLLAELLDERDTLAKHITDDKHVN